MASVLFVAGNARSLIANRGDLIRAMLARGHTVRALVPSYDLLPELDSLGIDWRPLAMRRLSMNPVADAVSFVELYRLIRELRPDKVFAYTIKPVVYGVPAAKLAGVPEVYVMITGMGYLFTGDTLKQRVLRAVARRLYRNAVRRSDAVFFQNPDDRALLSAQGILDEATRSVVVNGSGVDTARFQVAPIPPGPPVFLLIARLMKDKGVVEFVDAARRLRARHPESRFRIVGMHDAALPSAVSLQTIAQWREEGVVELLGHHRDVRPFIAEAHVFVLPSYREGTPRAALEAMSMGRPVVTTDAPGCREVVHDGENGFLVPPRQVEPLVEAMERFIRHPNLIPAQGAASRRIALAKYDVHTVNEVILRTMGLAERDGSDPC